MYPLGHMTFACGAVFVGVRLLDKVRVGGEVAPKGTAGPPRARPASEGSREGRRRIADVVDYRFVALGAVLPDVIDKPLTWDFAAWRLESGGHHLAHGLLFGFLLIVAGSALAVRGDPRVLLVAVGDVLHVLSDSVSHVPHSLLWPFLELDVPRNAVFLRASNIGCELVAAVIIYLAWRTLRREGRHKRFLRDGRL